MFRFFLAVFTEKFPKIGYLNYAKKRIGCKDKWLTFCVVLQFIADTCTVLSFELTSLSIL